MPSLRNGGSWHDTNRNVCVSTGLSKRNGLITAIPTLGALALGSQRLLPALQQMYSSYSQIKGASSSLKDVLSLLDQPLPTDIDALPPEPIKFETEVKLKKP